jgi:hypothetical protein
MTAAVLLDVGPAARAWPVPVVLGLHEGRRIALHPLALVGAAITVAVQLSQADAGPRDAFEVVVGAPTFFYGVLVFFAAHLVASRDRRAGTGELLAPLPSGAAARVAGLCLAALVPALLCAACVLVADGSAEAAGRYAVDPTAWHLAQPPLTVLGAALLGTMVARLTAVPGVALLVMVAMVLVDAWLDARPEDVGLLATYVTWPEYGTGADTAWWGIQAGSAAWHTAYLAGLCAMACAGAFLREARRPWLPLTAGAVATACTVTAGLAQLP